MTAIKRKFSVLGHNIAYSLSPRLHKAIFEFTGEDAEYGISDVAPDRLEITVKRLLTECDGFNVTKPYKERVAAMLGYDYPINTVKRGGSAVSTDPVGFVTDYKEAFGEPRGNILVLGAGGAAKAVLASLEECDGVESVSVYNRTYEKAAECARGKIKAVRAVGGGYDAVINCTSLGLGGEQSAPDSLDFSGVKYAYDLVYSPSVTPFMQKAEEGGAKARNGLGMLVWQAIAAHEFWRGEEFEPDYKRRLARFVTERIV